MDEIDRIYTLVGSCRESDYDIEVEELDHREIQLWNEYWTWIWQRKGQRLMMICFQNWQKKIMIFICILYDLCFVPVRYDTYFVFISLRNWNLLLLLLLYHHNSQ